MTWNPVAEPWRVVLYRRAPYPMYYTTQIATYASEEEARAALAQPFGRGIYEGLVSFAENAATWTRNGRWRVVAKRKIARGAAA